MDQLVNLTTRALLLFYLVLTATKKEYKEDLPHVQSMAVDTFSCPTTKKVSCPKDEPVAFSNLSQFLAAGGKLHSTCGIDSASFGIFNQQVVNVFCNKTTSTIYQIKDSCGGSNQCMYIVEVRDETTPVIVCPGKTLPCDGPEPVPHATYSQFITAITSDGGSLTDNCTIDTSSWAFLSVTREMTNKCLTAIVHKYTISDSCGNQAICNQRFAIIDNLYPSFVAARDTILYLNANCTADTSVATLGSITNVRDNCGVDSISHVDLIQSTCAGKFGSIKRIWRVVDNCKNVTIDTQYISVLDTIKPIISGPSGLKLFCSSDILPADTALIVVTDNCSPVTKMFLKDSIGDSTCLNKKTLFRFYKGADQCNNVILFTQVIKVNDTIPPLIQCPDSITVSCMSLVPASNPGLASAIDNCDGMVNILIQDSVIDLGCTNHQNIYRIFSAKDTCKNSSRCVQWIKVIDLIPPTLTCPADLTLECMSAIPAVDLNTVTATDNCSGRVILAFQKDSTIGQQCNNKKTIYRFYTGSDSCGNMTRCSQLISINDKTAPLILSSPNDTTVDCNTKVPAVNTGSIITSDNCGGSIAVTHLKDSMVGETCPNNKLIYRIYQATDECGNMGLKTQLITVKDTLPPVLMGPSNTKKLNCGSLVTLIVPTAADNCGGTYTVDTASRRENGNCPGNYKVVYTFTSTDSCNNVASRFDTVTFQDTTRPSIMCPPNINVDCISSPIGGFDSFFFKGGTAFDFCGIDSISFKLSNEVFSIGSSQIIITRTYTIKDLCDNIDSCSQQITSPLCFVDLALKKTINSTKNPLIVKPGSVVPFCITVYNQGMVAADSIKLIEYFPIGGTKIVTPGWINNANQSACKYLSRANGLLSAGGLLPGTNVQICFELQLSDTIKGGEKINISEINEVRDTFGNVLPDIDSYADNDPTNDSGGVPNTPDDDQISGNGNLGQDEDDADPALFFIAPALTCINNVNASVSVDATCSHCFKASELLTGLLLPDSLYKVTLFDSYGNKLPSNCVGPEFLGYTIKFSVSIPTFDNNFCWGTVKIEDKAPPQLDCKNDTLECIVYSRGIVLPVVFDNCSGKAEVNLINESWTDRGCSDTLFAGVLTRTIQTKDKWNNSQWCDKKYYIRRINIDSVQCPDDISFECPDTLNLNNPLITGAPIYKNIKLWPLHATCNLFMHYTDQRTKVCGAGFKIFRTWIIGDICSGKELKCIQVIKVEDHTPPRIDSLTRAYRIPSDPHECFGLLDLQPSTVTDCSKTFQAYVLTYQDTVIPNKSKTLTGPLPAKIKLPKGVNKLYIDIHDECNNYTRDSISITVTDETAPTPVCHAETQLTLDPYDCSAWITAKDLDNGSHDNCCDKLHFAAAYMQDIEKSRADFIAKLTAECGSKEYWNNKAWYDAYIEDWINYYIFKDTLVATECGTKQVVLRVYEACDLPDYDAHVFPCSPHSWYCYNTSWRYRVIFNQEFKKGGGKSCDVTAPWACKSTLSTYFNTLNTYSLGYYHSIPVYKNCDALLGTSLTEIACTEKLYNDCMIQLLLDDKQKPRINEIASITIYCDKVNLLEGESAVRVCPQGELYGSSPAPVWPGQIKTPGSLQVYGYYGGSLYPSHEDHPSLTDICKGTSDAWSPVYCRKWLELDSFDTETKLNPFDLFYKPVLIDKNHPSHTILKNEFVIFDNCIIDTFNFVDQKSINSCSEGWIQRTWTAWDKCGNAQTATQKIFIKHRSDFEVIFPEDKQVNCEDKSLADTGTSKAGTPIISDNDCEQLGIRYADEIFYTEPDACYKIVRTWTIIDWCIFDANQHSRDPDVIVNDTFRANPTDRICSFRNIKDNNDGYMTYVQIIKIVDHEAPKVTCVDKEFCVTDGCALKVNIPLNGTDNCSDTLFFKVDITNPDGTHDRRNAIQAIAGTFSVGTYKVTVTGEDGCRNADTCTFNLIIKDCKRPTPYCINGIATVIMPRSGELVVWAKDLNLNSTDNCTLADKLIYSFSKDIKDQSRKLTCVDIKNGIEQAIPVEIWVTDESGLQDFCSTYILIQDQSGNICPDLTSSTATLKGGLRTELKEPVEFAKLTLKGPGTEGLPVFQTNSTGTYYFGSLPLKGNYKVSANRDDNPLNGVSTLDLVLIQKHLLGTEHLNTPYKMIAADVDGSNSITVSDLVELRKLVLGLYDKLPNSTSWKFVPSNYQFIDGTNPWGSAAGIPGAVSFPQDESIQNISGDLIKDFIGVKIGDVNGSVIPHSLLGTEVRSSAHELIFEVEDQKVTAGQVLKVAFKSPNFRGISGWQGTLSLGGLKYVLPPSGIINGELKLSSGNIGSRWLDKSKLTLSWNEVVTTAGSVRDIGADQILFELEFRAIKSGYLSDMLRFGSQHTTAESYEGRGEIGGVKLEFKDKSSNRVMIKNTMDQNYPNPFNHQTVIGINLTEKTLGVFSIFDVGGRVIYRREQDWTKGYNEIKIDSKVLGAKGLPALYYYTFKSVTFNETKKMLFIE